MEPVFTTEYTMNVRSCLAILIFALGVSAYSETKTAGKETSHKKESVQKGVPQAVQMYEGRSRRAVKHADRAEDPYVKERLKTLSKSFSQLADHKRAAAEAGAKGEKYDWSDYHETKAEAEKIEKELKEYQKRHHPRAETGMKKDHSSEKAHAVDGKKNDAETAEKKTFKTESGFMIRTKL